MKKLSIKAMSTYLNKLIDHNIQSSLMIWGPPGIGKSAIVSMVAKEQKIALSKAKNEDLERGIMRDKEQRQYELREHTTQSALFSKSEKKHSNKLEQR